MPTSRKILLILLVLAGSVGVGWVGKALWERHERTVFATTLAQARELRGQARYAEAEPVYRAAFALAQRGFGPRHPKTLGTQIEWINVLFAEGRGDEAKEQYGDTDEVTVEILPRDFREPSRFTELLERLHLRRHTIWQPGLHQSLDGGELSKYVAPLFELEDHDALVELQSRERLYWQARMDDYHAHYYEGYHPPDGTLEHELAKVLQKQGRTEEATPLERQALEFDAQARKVKFLESLNPSPAIPGL